MYLNVYVKKCVCSIFIFFFIVYNCMLKFYLFVLCYNGIFLCLLPIWKRSITNDLESKCIKSIKSPT